MESGIHVRDIMTKDVMSITPDAAITDIADLLLRHGFTGAPVMQDGHLVGIVTEADFFARGEAVHLPTFLQLFSDMNVFKKDESHFKQEFRQFLNTKVRDIMTSNVITIAPDATVENLATIFVNKRVNPIPVVKNNKLVGIVSRSDIVKIFHL